MSCSQRMCEGTGTTRAKPDQQAKADKLAKANEHGQFGIAHTSRPPVPALHQFLGFCILRKRFHCACLIGPTARAQAVFAPIRSLHT